MSLTGCILKQCVFRLILRLFCMSVILEYEEVGLLRGFEMRLVVVVVVERKEIVGWSDGGFI